MMLEIFEYVPLGFAIGAIGTLVGAGGGFILMPILLMLFPGSDPEKLTAISLAVVFLNATSGTLAYVRMRRVNFKAGLWFAATALPGAVIGVWINALVPRRYFDLILGASLAAGAVFLIARSLRPALGTHTTPTEGTAHSYNYAAGGFISAIVGFISSLLGIGGGIVHVPALIYLLDFPAHTATATSHFVLALTALIATGIHIWQGDLDGFWPITIYLGAGVIVGAQLGARLSHKVQGVWIVRSLATALLLVGARLILKAL